MGKPLWNEEKCESCQYVKRRVECKCTKINLFLKYGSQSISSLSRSLSYTHTQVCFDNESDNAIGHNSFQFKEKYGTQTNISWVLKINGERKTMGDSEQLCP